MWDALGHLIELGIDACLRGPKPLRWGCTAALLVTVVGLLAWTIWGLTH